jgi:hypothetical protein
MNWLLVCLMSVLPVEIHTPVVVASTSHMVAYKQSNFMVSNKISVFLQIF